MNFYIYRNSKQKTTLILKSSQKNVFMFDNKNKMIHKILRGNKL